MKELREKFERDPIVRALLRWFARNARDLPWRRTRDPYAIWISEIMLQQTQVKTVVPYWENWMRALPNIQTLAKARSDRIHKLWEGLGYYTRVRNLQRAAQVVVSDHGGKVPERFEEVLALPGIGRYTAGAICSIAFNQAHPIVDGNVIRVLTRVYGIRGNPQEAKIRTTLWDRAEQLVVTASGFSRREDIQGRGGTRPYRARQEGACSRLNQSLMELGALICTPKLPACDRCPLSNICVALKESRVDELPELVARPRTIPRQFMAYVAHHDRHLFVQQRPAGSVNAHLWEFPNIEVDRRKLEPRQIARRLFGKAPLTLEALCSFKHSITRYRIGLTAYRIGWHTRPSFLSGRWIEERRVRQLAFTSAHSKILEKIGYRRSKLGSGKESSPSLLLRGNGAKSGGTNSCLASADISRSRE